jgi:hypothetical protein
MDLRPELSTTEDTEDRRSKPEETDIERRVPRVLRGGESNSATPLSSGPYQLKEY